MGSPGRTRNGLMQGQGMNATAVSMVARLYGGRKVLQVARNGLGLAFVLLFCSSSGVV